MQNLCCVYAAVNESVRPVYCWIMQSQCILMRVEKN